MEATGQGLVDFWAYAAEKGLMNANTAGSLRSACREVLSSVFGEQWVQVDLRSLDSDEILQRFERLRSRKFKPDSLTVYKSRFRNALVSYMAFLETPSGWSYDVRRSATAGGRQSAAQGERKRVSAARGSKDSIQPAKDQPPARDHVSMVSYPFPVRPGVYATLTLPEDITEPEVERLSRYVEALVVRGKDVAKVRSSE